MLPWRLNLLLMMIKGVVSDLEDNEVMGQPEIKCNTDTIDMQFKTRKPFNGKVYVKGSFTRPECRVDYSRRDEDGNPLGGIRLNHGACNMDRLRMLAPEGMLFSTVLIISFHPLFITRIDKAYHIKCMYREAVRTVTANIDVSMLPTESLSSDLPMPICSYTIRRDSLDGPIIRFARVGDQVVHRWHCDSEDYGVLVHSCYVEDGQGEKNLIVDESGCHTDRLLLGDPTYVEKLNMAYRESFVFKFADRAAVRFECEIRLCLKEDGGCDGITPPICDDGDTHSNSDTNTSLGTNYQDKLRVRRSGTRNGDLLSQTLFVMDEQPESEKNQGPIFRGEDEVCIGQRILLFVAALVAIVFVSAFFVAALVLHRRLHRKEVDDSTYHRRQQYY